MRTIKFHFFVSAFAFSGCILGLGDFDTDAEQEQEHEEDDTPDGPHPGPCGVLEEVVVDGVGDDSLRVYSYSASDLLTSINYDFGNDDSVDVVYSYFYDEFNRTSSVSTHFTDETITDLRAVYYYPEGLPIPSQIVQNEIEEEQEGAIVYLESFLYDAGGRLERRSMDLKGDNFVDTVTEYKYNELGQLIEKESIGYTSPGISTITYQYNALGQIDLEEHSGSDGSYDQISYYYDLVGNLIQQRTDLGKNEEIDIVYSYDYSCW